MAHFSRFPQIADRLARFRQTVFERHPVTMRLERLNQRAAGHTSSKGRQKLFQLVELEQA